MNSNSKNPIGQEIVRQDASTSPVAKLFFLFILALITSIGCKKNESSDGTSKEPECDPVHFNSVPANGVYIVMLNSTTDNAGSRTVQSVDQVRTVTNSLFRKYSIPNTQVDDVLNSINTGFIARLTKQQADELRTDKQVQLVEQDRVITLGVGCFTVVAPTSAQWGVRKIGAGDGIGKRVWIIDTGVQSDHPDLTVDKTLSKSFLTNETTFEDKNGHGTHVAGIIGALNNTRGVLGVASGVTIIALKALDGAGEGNSSTLIKALNYVGQNAKAGEVVNMSLGADTISLSLDNAVRTLADKGILFSIAAGNDAKLANLTSPARVNNANVFTVSAVDSLGRFAKFSNFGNDVVDLAAPGVDVISTWIGGQYARLSGTSMAAPHVAGILLLKGTKFNTSGSATNDPDGVPDPIVTFY
jgi:subtilisin